jgi:hypothetical protein
MAKLVVLLLTPRTYLPMEIFSFSKGFRLYKLLIKPYKERSKSPFQIEKYI